MTIRSLPLLAVFLGLASIQAGCGAQASSKVATTPQAAPSQTHGEQGGRTFAEPPPPPPPPPATATAAPTMPSTTAGMPPIQGQAMMAAQLSLEQEALRLEAPMTSCDLACRALGSLERAARVVCDLDQETDHPRCEQARSRLRTARARVRASCGQCAGGPTTDPDAPMAP